MKRNDYSVQTLHSQSSGSVGPHSVPEPAPQMPGPSNGGRCHHVSSKRNIID